MTERIAGVYCAPIIKKAGIRLNIKNINCALLFSIIVLGVFYVININDVMVKGFVLQDLKKQSASLKEDEASLNAEISYLKSYNNLADRVKKLGMVSADNVEYLKVDGGTLALLKQ
jgi:cell division protein FtsB